uniref:Uncharacterized protein n=1 Tax=Anopheles atroparvus TaxID=41427 RepID=A0AAG5CPI7_ANOAO
MHRPVLPQRTGIPEGEPALGAPERLLAGVDPAMHLQSRAAPKPPVTDGAHVRPFATMARPLVDAQMGQLDEPAGALIARVWPRLAVDALVLREAVQLGELLAALSAPVAYPERVRVLVPLACAGRAVAGAAVPALEPTDAIWRQWWAALAGRARRHRLCPDAATAMDQPDVRVQIALGPEAQRTVGAPVRPLLDVVQCEMFIYSAHGPDRHEPIDPARSAPVRHQVSRVPLLQVSVQLSLTTTESFPTDVALWC